MRIFNTYGPRMRLHDGRVVPAFISQALKNKPLTVFGEGEQTRSFCYCSDLIEGIYRLMMSGTNDPVNIGNPRGNDDAGIRPRDHRRHRLAQQIVFKPLPQDDPQASGSRTSAGPGSCWAGSRECRWRRDLSRLLNIFAGKYRISGPGDASNPRIMREFSAKKTPNRTAPRQVRIRNMDNGCAGMYLAR